MCAAERPGRYQRLARPTLINGRPEQARWADAMKQEMDRLELGVSALADLVSSELRLAPGTDKVRRWLANETTVDVHAIPALARAIGVHPLRMLGEYGLVDQPLSMLTARVANSERRFRRLRGELARAHGASGGALFAEAALRDGRWSVTVLPHWRGRRCRYHFADYVLVDRLDGISERAAAMQVFGEVFDRTGAEWDDHPFADAPEPPRPRTRVFVPRLTAGAPAESYAADLGDITGIVVAGPRWTGLYTVAALVAQALGWGRESFDYLARTLDPGGAYAGLLATELLRDLLAEPAASPHLVWAHILSDVPTDAGGTDQVGRAAGVASSGTPGFGGSGSAVSRRARSSAVGPGSRGGVPPRPMVGPSALDVRLLAQAPPSVLVVLLLPEDGPTAAAMHAVADLAGSAVERVRASVEHWRAALPERRGLVHLTMPTPLGADGTPVGCEQRGFLDGYFDSSVEVALRVLDLLGRPEVSDPAAGSPRSARLPASAGTLVPAAALDDPFAALAAGLGAASRTASATSAS